MEERRLEEQRGRTLVEVKLETAEVENIFELELRQILDTRPVARSNAACDIATSSVPLYTLVPTTG